MNKINSTIWVGGLMILILPCSSWLLIRLYRDMVHIPREIINFEKQEGRILAAIAGYGTDHGSPPEGLIDLVPDYLTGSSLKSGDWSFQYGKDEEGNFVLSSEAPSDWLGQATQRVCHSELEKSISCSYHYVCSLGKGRRYLTEPLSPDDFRQDLLTMNQSNPCFPPKQERGF